MLQVSKSNQKFKKLDQTRKVYSVSLLAGHSCPFAVECLSKAVELENGKRKIVDGEKTKFRCFSASQEAQYKSLYAARKGNLDQIKAAYVSGGVPAVADLIENSLKAAMTKKDLNGSPLVRPHVSGDFFKSWYLMAWFEVASRNPSWTVYCYTKAVPLIVAATRKGLIPDNFTVTLSHGGTHDHLIKASGIRSALVVHSEAEAEAMGLEIDLDDSLAATKGPSFALLIHGTQPKGSEAGKAVYAIKKAKRSALPIVA